MCDTGHSERPCARPHCGLTLIVLSPTYNQQVKGKETMAPKQQEEHRDRFRIMCEAKDVEMGPIIAQLSRMGLTNVHFELITDVPMFNKKIQHEVKAEDFLRAWIENHPTFATKEAIGAFREAGRTDGSGHTALRMLVEKKVLKKLAGPNYSRSDVKAIAAGKHTTKAKAKPAKAKKKFE